MTAITATAKITATWEQTGETITLGAGQYRGTYSVVRVGERTMVAWDGKVSTICGRCGGKGRLAEFGHVYAGECFACSYTGREHTWTSLEAACKAETARLRAAARRDAKAAAAAAEWAAGAATREVERLAKLVALGDSLYDEALAMDAARVAQSYVAPVGTRVKAFTGTVVVSMSVDGYMPGTYSRFVIVEGTGANAGQTVKMIGTADALYDMGKGEAVTFAATVKAHDTYKGVLQTVCQRPKLAS